MAQPSLSRRKALKILAGAPMLPLGGAATASLLATACGGNDDGPASPVPSTAAAFTTAAFGGLAAPSLADPDAMAKTTVASTMDVHFADGSVRTYKLAYQPFFITGDTVPNTTG